MQNEVLIVTGLALAGALILVVVWGARARACGGSCCGCVKRREDGSEFDSTGGLAAGLMVSDPGDGKPGGHHGHHGHHHGGHYHHHGHPSDGGHHGHAHDAGSHGGSHGGGFDGGGHSGGFDGGGGAGHH